MKLIAISPLDYERWKAMKSSSLLMVGTALEYRLEDSEQIERADRWKSMF